MKKMVRALILVIVCVMMTAPGAEIQAKTKKISLVLNGRKQRTVTISNSDKKSEMKIKVSKKSVVKVKRIKKSPKIRFTAKKKGTAKVTVCWKNKKRKKKISVYLVKVSEKQNKATKKTLTAKENAMRVFRKQNEYRIAAGVGKLEWSDELYDFLIYRMNKSGYDEHKNLNADIQDYFGLYASYKNLVFSENMLTSGSDSPTDVMGRWTKSSAHKRNYLDADHKYGAIAKVSTMWFAIFWDGEKSDFMNWRNYKLKMYSVKRFDTSTNSFLQNCKIAYYDVADKKNRFSTTIGETKYKNIVLEVGKTYRFYEMATDGTYQKANPVSVTVEENASGEIILSN